MVNLCRDKNLVPFFVVFKGSPDDALACPLAIGVTSVDQVDAGIEGSIDYLPGFLLGGCITEVVGSEAKWRNFDTGAS